MDCSARGHELSRYVGLVMPIMEVINKNGYRSLTGWLFANGGSPMKRVIAHNDPA